jgi:hypothetical protein
VAAAALAGVIAASVRQLPGLAPFQPVGVYAVLWAAFAVGAWLVLGVSPRRAVPLILLGGIAIQVAALSAPPQGSNDLYRYIWDGRVQAAGIDPYRYAPTAPQLVGLRDQFLWPADGQYCVGVPGIVPGTVPGSSPAAAADATSQAGPGSSLAPGGAGSSLAPGGAGGPGGALVRPAVSERSAALSVVPAGLAYAPPWAVPGGCTRINLPRVPTIYPPVAQAYFTAVAELAPPGSRSVPIQAAAALCAIATSVLLMAGLRRQRRDPRLAVLWAWCPVVGLQFGNGGHVDVLAAFLTAAALFTLARPGGRWRAIGGGVLLGLAVATKITPILAGPAVLRRRPVTVAAAAIGATVAVYLPHLLAVGQRVIGFLPGYLIQGGYTSGQHFPLVALIVPGKWATVAAVLILAAVGLAVLRTADPDRPWRGALVMTGAALAVTTPALLWYTTLLVVLVAMDGRAEWLALAAARYLTPVHPLPNVTLWQADRIGYAAALLIIAVVTVLRHRRQAVPVLTGIVVPASPARAVSVPAELAAAEQTPAELAAAASFGRAPAGSTSAAPAPAAPAPAAPASSAPGDLGSLHASR